MIFFLKTIDIDISPTYSIETSLPCQNIEPQTLNRKYTTSLFVEKKQKLDFIIND